MNFERYEHCRQGMIALHQKAFRWAIRHRSVFDKAAHKLGMAGSDRTLLLEDEEDLAYLGDALLYETTIEGSKTISAFFKANPPENDLEAQLGSAMLKATFGLYRVESTDPQRAETRLHGLVADAPDLTLFNVGLSATTTPGMVLATRTLSLAELNLATGAVFPFEAKNEKRLVRDWWSKQGIDRYAHYHKLFRRSGAITYSTL